jgi:hypothetical protein
MACKSLQDRCEAAPDLQQKATIRQELEALTLRQEASAKTGHWRLFYTWEIREERRLPTRRRFSFAFLRIKMRPFIIM